MITVLSTGILVIALFVLAALAAVGVLRQLR